MSLRESVLRLARANPELRAQLRFALGAGNTPHDLASERLKSSLESLGSNGYWQPPHNLAANFALMGVNLWVFTILPTFWQRQSYQELASPDGGATIPGIAIRPLWTSVGEGGPIGVKNMSGFADLNDKVVSKLLEIIKQAETLEATVAKELTQIEHHFKIQIPAAIKQGVVRSALPTAKRRWKVDRLRVKTRFIPLDGSKPWDLR